MSPRPQLGVEGEPVWQVLAGQPGADHGELIVGLRAGGKADQQLARVSGRGPGRGGNLHPEARSLARRGPRAGGLDGAAEQRLDAHLGQAARLQPAADHVGELRGRQLAAGDQQPEPVPAHRLAERIAHLAGDRGQRPRGPDVEPGPRVGQVLVVEHHRIGGGQLA